MARPICTTTGKVKFPNQLECDMAIADIQHRNSHHRRRKYREEPVRSYVCPHCKSWHMTSQEIRVDVGENKGNQ